MSARTTPAPRAQEQRTPAVTNTPVRPQPVRPTPGVGLSVAQLKTVQQAESSMTPDQKDRVRRRMHAVHTPSHDKPESDDIEPEALDYEAQRRALEAYAAASKSAASQDKYIANNSTHVHPAEASTHAAPASASAAEALDLQALLREVSALRAQVSTMKVERASATAPSYDRPESASVAARSHRAVTFSSDLPPEPASVQRGLAGPSREDVAATSRSLLPAAQVDPNSYLGRMFGMSEAAPRASSSVSAVSASAGTSAASRAASGLPEIQKKLVLKPREPKAYNGAANLQVFQKFALEAKNFLKGYNVEPDEHAMRISYYLTGRTWDYYLNAVMDEHESWDINRLLQGLFDYCFPVDHRQRQREKLEAAQQGNKSVKVYVHELNGLYSVVGYVPENMKVLKLWHSLNNNIREKLWWTALTPDTATWEEVRQHAELAELARAASEGVARRAQRPSRHDRAGSSAVQPRGAVSSSSRVPSETISSGRRNTGSRPPQRGGRAAFSSSSRGGGPSSSSTRPRGPQNIASRGILSEQERAEMRAAGKCFVCRETGHLSRNCPRGSRVQSNSKGHAPGLTSFNVELDFTDAEQLRSLAESTQGMDSLELGSMEVENEDFTYPQFPRVGRPRSDSVPSLASVALTSCDSDYAESEGRVAVDSVDDEDSTEGSAYAELIIKAWFARQPQSDLPDLDSVTVISEPRKTDRPSQRQVSSTSSSND
ncbi:hypothetical protein VTO73DRAFT_13133 [Trametes versicolor]